jgi:hypothetical protein
MKRQKSLEGNHQPAVAKYLLYLLLTHNEREDLLGDLEEDFNRAIVEFGLRRARMYYTFQALTSIAWLTLYRLERSRLVRALLFMALLALFSKLGILALERFSDVFASLLR